MAYIQIYFLSQHARVKNCFLNHFEKHFSEYLKQNEIVKFVFKSVKGNLTSCTGLFDFGRKEGNVLFNDALNTFYLRLYGVRHMVNDHSDSEKGNPLPPHGLLFPISSKGSFICTIPQTG